MIRDDRQEHLQGCGFDFFHYLHYRGRRFFYCGVAANSWHRRQYGHRRRYYCSSRRREPRFHTTYVNRNSSWWRCHYLSCFDLAKTEKISCVQPRRKTITLAGTPICSMSSEDSKMSRRFFLQSAASCLGVSVFDLDFTELVQPGTEDLVKTFDEIRANLLQLVNEERAVEKVPPLVVDELATRIASKHALDMATGNFASHWGRDGLKPYQRYSLAGGVDDNEEND